MVRAERDRRHVHPYKQTEQAKAKIGVASRRRVRGQRRDPGTGRFA